MNSVTDYEVESSVAVFQSVLDCAATGPFCTGTIQIILQLWQPHLLSIRCRPPKLSWYLQIPLGQEMESFFGLV